MGVFYSGLRKHYKTKMFILARDKMQPSQNYLANEILNKDTTKTLDNN